MADLRSKSYNANGMQIEAYHTTNPQDFRCYSASYASSSQTQMDSNNPTVVKFKKASSSKSTNGNNWGFADPELQRKKRVASYKVYTVEGKVKGSFRKGFRWIKDKYSQMVYGFRS